jgi:hypothetical protein
MNPWGLLVVAVGAFTIVGGLSDWPWFWNNHRARLMTTLLTRKGARVFYVVMGAGLAVYGLWATVSAV